MVLNYVTVALVFSIIIDKYCQEIIVDKFTYLLHDIPNLELIA